jgi:hypothetical protein
MTVNTVVPTSGKRLRSTGVFKTGRSSVFEDMV